MRLDRRSAVLAAALGALAIAFWHFRIVAPVSLPQPVKGWNSDLYTIYVPVLDFAYRSGTFLPSWNPHQLAGVPFLANYNAGVLYPPNFLAAVVPAPRALDLLSMAHVALAGVLTLLAARALGLSYAAATLAAVGMMFDGHFIFERFRPSYLAAIAWIPGVLLALVRLVERPTLVAGVLLGVVVALQLLTGVAQITLYLAYAAVLLAPIYVLQRRWTVVDARRLAPALVCAATVAILLAAIQLAPTVELVHQATRGFGGLTLPQTLPPKPSGMWFWHLVFMAGPLAVPAALAFVDARRPAVLAACTLLAILAIRVSTGGPLYDRGFYHLPGANLFRVPQVLAHVGVLALSILAGVGLDKALVAAERDSLVRRVVAVGAAAAVLWTPMPDGMRPYAVALVVVLGVVVLLPNPRWRLALGWLAVAIFAAERFAEPGNTFMMPVHNDAAYFAPPPFVEFLRARPEHDRILVIKNWSQRFPITEKLGTQFGLDVVQDYEPLAPDAYNAFLAPVKELNTDAPLFWGRFALPPGHPAWPLLDRLGVRWVVVAPGVPWSPRADQPFRLVYEGPDARVFESTRVLPRARLVPSARVVASAEETLAAIHANQVDPRTTVLLDRALPADAGGEGADADDVQWDRVVDDAVELTVTARRSSTLVLADLDWPGWRASIDGVEQPVARADYLFRAVAVPPGRHVVRFWFAPASLRLGGVASALGLVLIAVVLYGSRRSRGRREGRSGLQREIDLREPFSY